MNQTNTKGTGKNVLLVEDDVDIANVIKMRLENNGYHVKTAFDAVTAATVARRFKPDVVLLDITMPGGDGFLVADRLRANQADTPFIFLTASDREDYRTRAEEIGAAAYLKKPFISEELMSTIERVA